MVYVPKVTDTLPNGAMDLATSPFLLGRSFSRPLTVQHSRFAPHPQPHALWFKRNSLPVASDEQEESSREQQAAPSTTLALVVSGTSYCLTSVLMVLANKYALAAVPGASSPTCLLFLQCAICAVLVASCQLLGLVKFQRLNWHVLRAWIPSNMLFVFMLWTSVVALRYLSVPMVTVLKSLSNVFTIAGDYAFFGRTYSSGVWWSLVLITLSSIAGGLTDLEFSAVGYAWQLLNCAVTAAYSLYIKKAMQDAAEVNTDKQPLSENSMVLLNNALSLPMLAAMMAVTGELDTLSASLSNMASVEFAGIAIISGIISFGLSYSSLWFLSVSTPTSYSLVGNLNKVPTAIGSYLIFHDRVLTSPPSLASLMLGVVGGMVFVTAKSSNANVQRAQAGGVRDMDPYVALGDGGMPPLVALPRKRKKPSMLLDSAASALLGGHTSFEGQPGSPRVRVASRSDSIV